MKRVIILVLFTGTILVSCRKTRSCECKITVTYTPENGGNVITDMTSIKTTKEEQRKNQFRYEEKCFSRTVTYTIKTPTLVAGNYVEQYICEIK